MLPPTDPPVMPRSPKKQAGWFLLETLLSLVIGFFVVTAATDYVYRIFSQLTQISQTWNTLGQFEKWRVWMQDELDAAKARSHCSDWGQVSLTAVNKQQVLLHSCRWVNQHWQWLDTSYFVKSKKGMRYLYEKTGTQPAVAWLAGIKHLGAHAMAVKKIGAHLLSMDFDLSDSTSRSPSVPAFCSHAKPAPCGPSKPAFCSHAKPASCGPSKSMSCGPSKPTSCGLSAGSTANGDINPHFLFFWRNEKKQG